MEAQYFNGNNEVVKILIRCVLYVMKEIAFMHLDNVVISVSVCEQCYQSKGDIDILKCVVCRT